MNGRKRVAEAMQHGTPDRVPVMCQLALGHYFVHCGADPAAIWFDSRQFAATLEEFRRRYGFDGLLVNLPGRPANWQDYLTARETTEAGQELRFLGGRQVRVPPDDNAQAFDGRGGPLARADAERLDPLDPATYRTPGYVWNTWHAPTLWDLADDADLGDPAAYPSWFTAALRAAREACPDGSVHVEVFSPFTHLLELFGYDRALMALVDRPQTCQQLLDRFTRMVEAQVSLYAACDPDAVLVSSAFAGAGFISRAMYRQFVVPYERRVAAAVHHQKLPCYTHTCGAIGDRLDLMAETEIDGIDTLDPPPLGTVDLARAKAEFGDRFFFKGNLDAVNEMLRADDGAFEQAVRRRLEVGMPGGGYILSSACSVAPHVDPARLGRMVELAERYGRYAPA